MRTTSRLGILGIAVTAGALVLSGAPAMAATSNPPRPAAYTCTGGDIPSGHYASVTVKGACAVAANAVIRVSGDVNVKAGATLDAQSAPSRITVGRNVNVARGALLGLGCQPDFPDRSGHPCTVEPKRHSTISVKGNVTAIDANTVLLNGITVGGNVTLIGGGGRFPGRSRTTRSVITSR